jgi:hypothetical protein
MKNPGIFSGRNGFIMRSVMNAIIPRGGPFAAGAADYDLLPAIEEIILSSNPVAKKIIPWILKYIQFSSLIRRGRTFTKLHERDAAAFLDGMEASPFYYRRSAVLILKTLTVLAFYDIDDVAAQIGYVHGCRHDKGF